MKQILLEAGGYYGGEIDGVYGNLTAVAEAQVVRKYKLDPGDIESVYKCLLKEIYGYPMRIKTK